MHDHRKAYLYGLTTVLCWSTVATAFKLSLRYLDIFQLLFYASLTSSLVLLLLVASTGRLTALRRQSRRQLARSAIAGCLNPFLYYLILLEAYDLLPAQVAQPINYTWAITLSVMSLLILKQAITARDLLAGIVCYGGVLIITGQGTWFHVGVEDLRGVSLALLSTVVWAGYWIVNMSDERDPMVALTVNFLLAVPATAAAVLLFSEFAPVHRYGILGAVYVGCFEMSIAFYLWSKALRLAENASKVSNLIFISPFLSLLFIHVFLGETIFGTTYVGLALIVAGLMYQRFGQARQ